MSRFDFDVFFLGTAMSFYSPIPAVPALYLYFYSPAAE